MVLALAVALAATGAGADTIYLANGRKIHTESVSVEDDRVVFTQFGGTVSIPLDQVTRIEEDDESEGSVVRADASGDDAAAAPTGAPPDGLVPARATAANAGEPWRTPEYWIDRIKELDDRMARVQAELDHLPAYSDTDQRLFRFSGQIRYFIAEREKWQRLMNGMQLHRRQLVHGARKAGITPGALREGLRR